MPDEEPVPVTVVPAVSPGAPPEAPPQEEEEIDLIADLVAQDSIEREEQHSEVMETLAECQIQLQNLTALSQSLSQSQTAENPLMMDLSRQITELKGEVAKLVEELSTALKPSSPEREESSSPKAESPTSDMTPTENGPSHPRAEEPSTQEPPAPNHKRRRFRKL
jgi:peptidoglycan hydrolase CwlO-like protein